MSTLDIDAIWNKLDKIADQITTMITHQAQLFGHIDLVKARQDHLDMTMTLHKQIQDREIKELKEQQNAIHTLVEKVKEKQDRTNWVQYVVAGGISMIMGLIQAIILFTVKGMHGNG